VMISLTPVILIAVALMVGGRSTGEDDEPAETVAKADLQKEDEKAVEDEPVVIDEDDEPEAPTVPPEVEAAVKLLFDPEVSDKERSVGATKVSEFEPDDLLPAHVRASAQLVLASKCTAKKAILLKLRELDAAESLPVLQALDRAPRNKCGTKKRKKDCYSCLREDLARTVGRFEVLAELAEKKGS